MTGITRDNGDEMFPVVDENGNCIGKALRRECHGGSMKLHPVVHLHLFDRNGRLYLQRRPEWKDIQPGKWDTAVGGHVDYGEAIADALCREACEELGIAGFEPYPLAPYVFESERERELVNPFMTVSEDLPQPSDETDGGRFWTLDEISESIGQGVLTPNFEKEFARFDEEFRRILNEKGVSLDS